MRKLTLSLAVLAALLPGQVVPLGLGEIELNSALNQELQAEIEVLAAAPEDTEQLIVKLASREAFARAGIDRPFLLQDLKFKTLVKGDKPYIQVYTVDPIREPYLSFLVEVDWPNGHLLREYTLLLDPPVIENAEAPAADSGDDDAFFETPADASAEPAATEVASAAEAAEFEPVAMEETVAEAPVSGGVAAATVEDASAKEMPVVAQQQEFRPAPQYSQQASGQYRIKESDTLWALAERLRPNANVSVEQMMLALMHENPECFIKENVNGLKRGYILRMPDSANITTIDRQTALEQVRQHNSLWREYRQNMSAAMPASAMESSGEAQDASASAGEARLDIVSAAGSDGSETSLSGQSPKGQVSKLKRELSLSREALESERLEKENLKQRLSELEQRVQRVLEMDDAELAKLQADLAGVKKDAEKITAPKPLPEQSLVADEPVAAADGGAADSTDAAGEEPLFMDETATPDVAPEQTQAVEAVEETPVNPTPAPVVQQPEPSFISGLLQNPLILAIIAGVVVVIGGAVALVMRRRKADSEAAPKWADTDQALNFDDAVESVGEPYVKPSLDATAEMPVVDLEPIQPIAAAFSPSEPSNAMEDTVIGLPDDDVPLVEQPRDDVLAESDVYLAYGIYQQAEELLSNALRQHPDRDDYRMKLLETHFASKNASAFAELAAEAKQRKGSVKSYWDRVVVMGRELCPDNAMFSASADFMPDMDMDDLLPRKPVTTDFELDASGMAPDLDLGFTETPAKPGKSSEEPVTDFSLDSESTMILQAPVQPEAPLELDLAADLENIASAMAEDKPEIAAAELSADLDLGELDFTAEAPASSDIAEQDDEFSLDLEASDLGLINAEPESGAEFAAESAMLPSDDALDLGMDLDMAELGSIAEPIPDVAIGDDDFDISQLSEDVDEINTKLDLARAYMDMGDNEGARNILEEVCAEGNPEQQAEAEALLANAG